MKEKNKKLKKPIVAKKKPKKKKDNTADLTAKALIELGQALNRLTVGRVSPDDHEEEYQEPIEPLDLGKHCEEMSYHFHETIKDLKDWLVIQICVDYAVVCRRINVKVNISLNDDKNSVSMQPYTPLDPETRTFCAIRAFVWSDEARSYDFIKELKLVGAEVKDLYVIGDIKKALGVA